MTAKDNQNHEKQPRRLVDIAAELGYNPSGFLRVVRRRGFEPFKLQEGQNKPYYLSWDDAEELSKRIQNEKDLRITPNQEDSPSGLSGVYAIEVPDYDGSVRIKIGWSNNISERLSTYRTIVPDLRILRVWPCMANWYEQMALTWARKNGRQVGQEIFEFDNNKNAIDAMNNLFASLGIKSQNMIYKDYTQWQKL